MTRDPATPADAPAAATPRLERLLRLLRRRLAGHVWLHGLGTLVAIACGWLAFAYLADRVLRVPHAVRVAHGALLVALVVFAAWRWLLRPLASLPSRAGLAVLFERRRPELRERLVSAVQLQARGAREEGSPTLVRRVLAEADELAGSFAAPDVRGTFDAAVPRRRFLEGALLALALCVLALRHPGEARIFLARMLGSATPWPQRTTLTVDVPLEGPGVQITREPERIHVRVSRGTDVPVLVKADGVVPEEVRLRFDAGRDMVLTSAGGNAFRTLLRSCQENVAFVALGGDDLDGRPVVSIEVLRPPDVEGIAFQVHPPEYAGMPDELVFQREVSVLAGSELRVHVLPQPRDARGQAWVLPEERAVALAPEAFPARAGQVEPGEPVVGLAFDWRATSSVGIRVELSDRSGLTNPDPGLFRIRVVEDRPPEVSVLAPARSEFEVVRGGAFALRARAEDDFAVRTMRWRVGQAAAAGGAIDTVREGDFALRAPAEGGARQAVGHVRLEVDELGTPERPVAVDQRFEIAVEAEDNRQPQPNQGKSPRFRARVVTPEELLRRMQDRLAQARLAAVRLSDLQREKQARVRELLESSEGDASGLRGESPALASALAGQRRVAVDARALARELASIGEDILYARVDAKAALLLDFYDARAAEIDDGLFHPEPWLALAAARRDGTLEPGGFGGNLVELVELALVGGERHVQEAALALAAAEKATSAAEVRAGLLAAAHAQEVALLGMDELLARLAEWDNFQNILSLTRDILNRQKALRERTQQFASKK